MKSQLSDFPFFRGKSFRHHILGTMQTTKFVRIGKRIPNSKIYTYLNIWNEYISFYNLETRFSCQPISVSGEPINSALLSAYLISTE